MNNDPTGFKAYFPWIHPEDWTYPAPNHSRGLLDGLQTTFNIISKHTHTLTYFHRPAPPIDSNELYPEDVPDLIWGKQKIHPADNIHIPGIKLQSDYFKQNETKDPKLTHFTLWLTHTKFNINMNGFIVVIPQGTPICLNALKTSIGVTRGQAKCDELISYPRRWIHPLDKYIDWEHWIKNETLQAIPEVTGMTHIMNTPPDMD